MEITQEELERRFNYHEPNAVKVKSHELIRVECKGLARVILSECPEGREKSLALTHLEEVMFWSNASVARG